MSEREAILARVRRALQRKAKEPGSQHGEGKSHPAGTPASGARRWLPAVGDRFEERIELFRRNIVQLKGEFILVASRAELGSRLKELQRAEGWRGIGAHGGELIEEMAGGLGLPICRTDRRYDVKELEKCDAGITGCDALVAQTGSVLVSGRSAGGRALSVLPPHHVVLSLREQLVADLPDAFGLVKQKYSANYPSFISLITGPSRTGDIERILVLGAHGPKKLTIYCL